jgi:hypothetical protein
MKMVLPILNTSFDDGGRNSPLRWNKYVSKLTSHREANCRIAIV